MKTQMKTPLIVEFDNPVGVVDSRVAVLVPVSPNIRREYVNSCLYLAQRAVLPFRHYIIALDPRGAPPPKGKPHPYRQSALAKIRQDMVDCYLGDSDWVFWVDADIVDYKSTLLLDLVSRADGGIAAPVVLMDGELGQGPAYEDGFGWGKFFDVGGFVENGRWARFEQPWFDQPGPVFELDSVGGCYVVRSDLYRQGAKYAPDYKSLEFIATGALWETGIVGRNQMNPANCFTEHYSVCQWARSHGYPVRAFADLVVRHAKI